MNTISSALHLPTALFLAGVVGTLGTILAATTLRRVEGLASPRVWLAFSAIQALSCFIQSTRDGPLPESVAIIFGNGTQLLALGLLWLGTRRLRGVQAPAWTALVPALIWFTLCLVPEFLDDRLSRHLYLWPAGFVLLAATALNLWHAGRDLALRSATNLSITIGLVALLPTMRLVQLATAAPYSAGIATIFAVMALGTAVPCLALSIAIERSAQLHAEREAAAISTGRAQVERLLGGLPAVIFLREVADCGASRLLYRGGDVANVTGWPAGELDNVDNLEPYTIPGDPTLTQSVPALLQEGQTAYEWRMRQPCGGSRWMKTTARVMTRTPDGTAEIVGYTVNITPRRDAQARAMSAARLASLGEMAAGLAHEIKQPLQTISLAAEIAQIAVRRQDAEEADRRLENIADQTQRTAALVDRLRRFARGGEEEEGPPVAVSLAVAIQGALDMTHAALHVATIGVEVSLGTPTPVVLGHPILLEQVLTNLLLNARDALAGRPPEAPRRITIAATAGGGETAGEDGAAAGKVRLTVADTGGGIDPAVIERLFEPFVTTKGPDRGTGLGLSICHGLIRSMGGTIEAHNDEQGAVFSISLPIAPLPATTEAA